MTASGRSSGDPSPHGMVPADKPPRGKHRLWAIVIGSIAIQGVVFVLFRFVLMKLDTLTSLVVSFGLLMIPLSLVFFCERRAGRVPLLREDPEGEQASQVDASTPLSAAAQAWRTYFVACYLFCAAVLVINFWRAVGSGRYSFLGMGADHLLYGLFLTVLFLTAAPLSAPVLVCLGPFFLFVNADMLGLYVWILAPLCLAIAAWTTRLYCKRLRRLSGAAPGAARDRR